MSVAVYQIAIIVVLTLNLIFWILAICFRIFFDCSCDRDRIRISSRTGQRRRNSRIPSSSVLRGRRNPAFVEEENLPTYSSATTFDVPPPYEEAMKLSIAKISSPRHDLQINTFPRFNGRIRPNVYERPVTLMVPEERTSLSETRLTAAPSGTQLSSNVSSDTLSTSAEDTRQASRSQSGFEEILVADVEDVPFTFVIDSVGPQAASVLGIANTTAVLSDGNMLETHSKA